MVNGSHRLASPVTKYPLKSMHHSCFGARDLRERLGAWRGAFPLLLRTGYDRTAQYVAECSSRRPHHIWLQHLQPCFEFPCAPRGMLGPKHEDGVLDWLKRGMGATMRACAPIHQSFRPSLVVAIDPAIGRWARDPIRTTKVRYILTSSASDSASIFRITWLR
jgi:hypothetical protein